MSLVYLGYLRTMVTGRCRSTLLAEKKRKVRFVFPLSSYVVSVRPLTHSTTLTINLKCTPYDNIIANTIGNAIVMEGTFQIEVIDTTWMKKWSTIPT